MVCLRISRPHCKEKHTNCSWSLKLGVSLKLKFHGTLRHTLKRSVRSYKDAAGLVAMDEVGKRGIVGFR